MAASGAQYGAASLAFGGNGAMGGNGGVVLLTSKGNILTGGTMSNGIEAQSVGGGGGNGGFSASVAGSQYGALGLSIGVFHVELKQTSRGARLIEVNCRMGGGPVRATNLLVWGVDLVEEHLLTAAGIPSRPPVAPAPLKFIAEYSINAKKTGKISAIDFLEKYEAHPDVLYARPLVAVGEKVTAVEDGMPTWVAELMVEKPTVEEAIEFVQQIERETVVPVV